MGEQVDDEMVHKRYNITDVGHNKILPASGLLLESSA